MTREELETLVIAWDPSGEADLPDEIAAALDADPAFRAWFDDRFAKWTPAADAPAPQGLEERVLPKAPRRSRRALWLALGLGVPTLAAAGALFTVMTLSLSSVERLGPAEDGRASAPGSEAPIPRAVRDTGDPPDAPPPPPPKSVSKEKTPAKSTGLLIIKGQTATERQVNPDGTLAPKDGKQAELAFRQKGEDVAGATEDVPVVINGWEDAASDARSTFSVDVDAGSYTQARRTLRSGYLPSPGLVRVEEFVNYLPYDYAPPAQGAFAVHVEGAPAPWGDTQVVRIGLQGKKVGADQRSPAHLTFLVDVSGSMSNDDKLPLVQKSLKMLVDELRDGDTVALVVYAGSSGVVLEPTPVSDAATIRKAIDRLSAGGSTAMGDGIRAAYALAERSYEPGATNRVIIASDGDANVGVTDTATLTELIASYADRGITLTTLGFGTGNYRDQRMEQLANDGDGNYYYVDSEAEARRVLVDRMTSTLEVIARDVKLQVDWNPKAVERYRLLGYENRAVADRDFRNDAVDAGEVGAGHQVTAIYEVDLADAPQGDLFTLRMRSKAPGPEAPSVESSWTFAPDVLRPSVREASADFRVALSAALFAERLRGSEHAPGFDYDDIAALLATAKRAEYPEDAELAELVGIAARLDR